MPNLFHDREEVNLLFEFIKTKNSLQTTKRLPSSIRGTIFETIVEAISEEILDWRNKTYEQKTTFFDIDLMDMPRILEISRTLNMPIFLNIKSNLSFLREELRNTFFKVCYRGTPVLYKSFFNGIDRSGNIVLYAKNLNSHNITRLMQLPFDEASLTHSGLPFKYYPINALNGNVNKFIKLDDEQKILVLDSIDIFELDQQNTFSLTNHIGLEYFIDRLVKKDDKYYLMSNDFFEYLEKTVEVFRRAKEVPHIGAQLSIQIDTSGLCNSFNYHYKDCDGSNNELCRNCEYLKKFLIDDLDREQSNLGKYISKDSLTLNDNNYFSNCYYKNGGIHTEYTIPSLKLKAVTNPCFYEKVNSSRDFAYIEFGEGTHDVASEEKPNILFPNNLAKRLTTIPLLIENILENDDYFGVTAEFKEHLVSEQLLNTDECCFDGKNQKFEFTLNTYPVHKNTVILSFYLPSGEEFTVKDNSSGELLGKYINGTIDYETGLCRLNTKFSYSNEEVFFFISNEDGLYQMSLNCDGDLIAGSIELIVMANGKNGEETYSIKNITLNNNKGAFLHSYVDFDMSYVDYKSKNIVVKFNTLLTENNHQGIIVKYDYYMDKILPKGTMVKASYRFRKPINITEVGIRNINNELIAYTTFPPIEILSEAYHFNFTMLIRKYKIIIDAGHVSSSNYETIYDGLTANIALDKMGINDFIFGSLIKNFLKVPSVVLLNLENTVGDR